MTRPGPDPHRDAGAVLSSLAEMVARSSAAGTLPESFLAEVVAADPSLARLTQVLELAGAARVRFGAAFLREAGLVLLDADPPTHDGGLAWLRAAGVDPRTALDVLEDRELARTLVTVSLPVRAADRERSRLLRTAAAGEGEDRARSVALSAWAREQMGRPDAPAPHAIDGLVALALRDVIALDEAAADPDHPARSGILAILGRARGDQLVLSSTADTCVRLNRLRVLGAAPADRAVAVAVSCRLLDFALTPLLGDPRRGEPGQTYLRIAHDLTAMTALWSVVRDGRELLPERLGERWPTGTGGSPARVAELDRRAFRDLLDLASVSPGLAGDLVRASRGGYDDLAARPTTP